MLSFGITDQHYFRFVPGSSEFEIELIEMVKKPDEKSRLGKVAVRRKIFQKCANRVGSIEAVFTKPVILVDFSSYRESDHVPVRTFEQPSGTCSFEVWDVTLPSNVREGVLKIVLLPNTFLGLALVGLETILAKQARAEQVAPPSHPFVR